MGDERFEELLGKNLKECAESVTKAATDPAHNNGHPVYEMLAYAIALAQTIGEVGAERREELERRVYALESCGIKYRGVWQRADSYKRGDVVTHKGSAWIVLHACEGVEPGEGAPFQLMVKRGSDGKDAR